MNQQITTQIPSAPVDTKGQNTSWIPSAITPVCILIGLLFFIKPLTRLIDRIQKGKVGTGGAEFDSPTKSPEIVVPAQEEQVSEDVYKEKETEIKEEFIPKTYGEWRTEMVIAALMKDKDKFESSYQELLKLSSDVVATKKAEIAYWSWKHTLGDTDAISHIKKYTVEQALKYEAKLALGFCYNNSEDFTTASLIYKEAVDLAENEEDKIRAVDRYANALYSNGQKRESEMILETALSNTHSPENKAYLYSELADFYEKEKDYERRAIVIEKALEVKPNDTSLLFKAGYSYSRSSYDELALFHYLNAKKINPDDASVRNNLGVQYENLGMPFKSVANYQEAAKRGETLALSNIAYRLMNAGFDQEARERLAEAQKSDNPHENIGQATSDLAKRKEAEEDREKAINKTALQMRKFILSFADARYSIGTSLANVRGDWLVEDYDTTFHIEVTDGEIRAFWKEKLSSTSTVFWDYSFKGKIYNDSSEIIITRDGKFYGEGRIFLDSEGNIQFMSTGDFKKKEVLKLYQL